MDERRELLRLLAEVLEYPDADLLQKVRRCRGLLVELRPESAPLMDGFIDYLDSELLGRQEEVYSATFDLKPQCYPYAGYQLFGEEDPRRTELMMKLRESYRGEGFEAGDDLPDNVSVLLRFLAHVKDDDLERDLSELVMSPVLKKMAETLESKSNPYGKAVSAAAAVVTRL
jgi:nitrate reductase delta subunit